jgi:2-keto-4-pentenoate hydratase/2-oxohepta-3-ene-1,7-dioic acid hydratase in catechol pathway
MRFIVGRSGQLQGVFAIEGDVARFLSQAKTGVGPDLMALARGDAEVPADGPEVAVPSIRPALPIARPGKIICLGLNYVDHIKEGGYEIPTYPALFMRGQNSVMAAGEPMLLPMASERLDYEAELMVIIGRGGKHIAEADALDHVFGYTVFNDGSIRDYQRKTHQWTPGKNFDATGPIGPVVVTPDELPAGARGLKIETRVGAEVLQTANTNDMLWPVDKTIATISEYATLEPGDMIAMGTPPGVGHARTPPRWLRAGETVEVEVEGICICASPIVAEADLMTTTAAE